MFQKLLLIIILVFPVALIAQDPASFLLGQQGSFFNPALAGTGGSQSISLAYRQEWISSNDAGYHTVLLSYDESMPCSVLDFGINALWDQEGSGFLSTYEISPKVSVNIPLIITPHHQINARLGGGMSFGRQQIQFDRLVFSDQLHPKYGNILPTNFVAPDEDVKGGYFQPAIGFVIQGALNKLKRNAILFNIGSSYHNAYALGRSTKVGYGKSVLGLLAPQAPRLTMHADIEIIPGSAPNRYISLKPSILYERQAGIYYMQYGLDIGLTNAFRVGGYFHQQKLVDASNTNWFSISTLFRPYIGEDRIDFYVTYSFNVSGLRHTVSPLMEIGIKKHFKSSLTCRLMGQEDAYNHNRFKCPWFSISPAKKKFYGNVWY